MACINGFIILCLLITVQLLLGILFLLSDEKENKCEMTYMFEYPQFVRIGITPQIDKIYKRYGLYAYSEGRFTERARNMYFDGIPVLFIPGNKGSEKQVRSFASVALRKALDSRPGFYFDFFTVDLNEEFSALNGALLNQQTSYIKHCIKRILQLYEQTSSRHKRNSVILFGHSMGGIIAQNILSSLHKNSTLLPLVITLAAYHTRPPLALDYYMYDYYKKIYENIDSTSNTTLISIAGGFNDLLVPTYLTQPKWSQQLHTVTTSVPKVWLSVDHLCILWCKQLVLAVTRALFECIDPIEKHIIGDPERRLTVFKHHLVHNSGIKIYHKDRYELPVNMRMTNDEWIEKLSRQHSVNLPHGTKHTQWHMIRLIDQPKHEALTLVAINLEVTDWVFVCPAIYVKGLSRVCEEGNHLSHYSEIAPTADYKRRTLRINLHQLQGNYRRATHVIVKIPPTDDPVVLHVDVFSPTDRVINVTLPKWWSVSRYVVLEETSESIVHFELRFPQLTHMVQSYLLYITPIKCKNAAHHATASFIAPWAYQDIHTYITNTEKDPLELRLYSSKPHGAINLTAYARLTLDPMCKYSISIKSSYLGMLGQMTRLYSPLLIANTAVVILLSLRSQLHCIAEKGYCSLFFTAVKEGVKPYYILTTVKVASKILSLKTFTEYFPSPDWQILAEDGSELFLLPLFLYMCSVGIAWLLAGVLVLSLIICESTVHKITLKFLAKNVIGVMHLSDWLMSGLHKIPSIVAVILILISLNTCGALSLCLGTIFYFLMLTQMSQDCIEDIVSSIIKSVAKKISKGFSKSQQHSDQVTGNTETKSEVCEKESNENEALLVVETKGTDEKDMNQGKIDDNTCTKKNKEDIEESHSLKENLKNFNAELIDKENLEINRKDGDTSENNKDRISIQEEYEDSETNATMGSDETPELQNVQSETGSLLDSPSNDSLFFHFTMFLLWCMITFLTFPSVLTWAHNFKYSNRLKPDPSFIPGLVLSFCAAFLWQMEVPKLENQWYKELGYIIYFLAAISLVYATLSLYRLVFMLTVVFALIVLHQLFAPKLMRDTSADRKLTDGIDGFEAVKAKWE